MDYLPLKKSRDPEEQADIDKAFDVLQSNPYTACIIHDLYEFLEAGGFDDCPGWKYLRAAEKLVAPGLLQSQRRSIHYYWGIVARIGDDERVPMTRAQRIAKDFADEWAKRRKDAKDGDDF